MATKDKITGKKPRPFTQLDNDRVHNFKGTKGFEAEKKRQAAAKKKGR